MAGSSVNPLSPVNRTGNVLKRRKKAAKKPPPEDFPGTPDKMPSDDSTPDDEPPSHIDTFA